MDRDTAQIQEWEGHYQNCQVLNFTLDGKTYTACEDPNDGYRSSMRCLRTSDTPTKNPFHAVKVLGRMKADGKSENDVLELLDCKTGKTVLEVGTENTGDYYPCFVANWSPENMACNQSA